MEVCDLHFLLSGEASVRGKEVAPVGGPANMAVHPYWPTQPWFLLGGLHLWNAFSRCTPLSRIAHGKQTRICRFLCAAPWEMSEKVCVYQGQMERPLPRMAPSVPGRFLLQQERTRQPPWRTHTLLLC